MFEKLKDFYALFTAGQSVANAIKLKKVQVYGGAFAGFLGAVVAIAKAFGYDLPISDEQLVQLGGAAATIFGMFNMGATVASTDKFGLPSREAQARHAADAEHISVPRISTESTPAYVQSESSADDPLAGLDTTHVE